MQNKTPLVSVLMTVYNAQDFVQKAVESVSGQTYLNLELIIVDDGSTDRTPKILRNLVKNDKRIKVVYSSKNYGPSYASNVGLKLAKGKYIARMDADDISYSTRIEKQVDFLEKHPDIVLLGGQCKLIDEEGNIIGSKKFPIKHNDIYRSLFKMNPIQHPTFMINTNLVKKNKIVYKNHSVLAHDLEMIFDLERYGKLANLKENILYYRQHSNSLSLKNPKETFKATLNIRRKAVKIYGYQPSFSGKIYSILQTIVVTLLPSEAIYPIYRILRMNKKESLGEVIKDIKSFIQSKFASRFTGIKINLATYLSR